MINNNNKERMKSNKRVKSNKEMVNNNKEMVKSTQYKERIMQMKTISKREIWNLKKNTKRVSDTRPNQTYDIL